MKHKLRVFIFAVCTAVLLVVVFLLVRLPTEVKLHHVSSIYHVRPIAIGASPFDESAELLFQGVRRTLMASEHDQALRKIAADMEWKLEGQMPTGVRTFEIGDDSIQNVLNLFGETWGVSVRIEGNLLIFTPELSSAPE